MQILSQGKYQNAEITNLITKFPKEESNYISLIYLYSKNNETDKVLETARKLETAIPHPNGRKSVCSNITWQ
jgi:hypothetical protein